MEEHLTTHIMCQASRHQKRHSAKRRWLLNDGSAVVLHSGPKLQKNFRYNINNIHSNDVETARFNINLFADISRNKEKIKDGIAGRGFTLMNLVNKQSCFLKMATFFVEPQELSFIAVLTVI